MKKFAIMHGRLENDIQKRALAELTAILLDGTLEYPPCFAAEETAETSDTYNYIYLGTKENNPYIREHSKETLSQSEEYCITVENDTVMIEGFDDAGALYGALDFHHKYIVKFEYPDSGNYWEDFLSEEHLPDFQYTSAPSVKERGLWTWGHVIYDYRGYLDNMMKLKMNRVIIWNDFLPVNAADIVQYAHSRNIKVLWGFSWLWDTNCSRFDLNALEGCPEDIFAKYLAEYTGVEGDGIYFQTFTELGEDNINGVLVAKAAANFVNRTAALFYQKYPDLEIQFGLHAQSVHTRLEFIKTVDPRIRIVWEDCGAFPFSYIPRDIETFDETKAFVKTISCLRGENDRFGAVTKGLVKLDWSHFEHAAGAQWIGVSSKQMKKNRIDRKHKIWRYIQACWFENADKAYEMVQEMYRIKGGELCIFALVEDGMFEETVMYPVALYAEMLWDCHSDAQTLMREVALRNYVDFA